jgi:uncharacterized protein
VAPFAYAQHSAWSIKIERHELSLPRWNADGFRLALLGDLHANNREKSDRAKRAMQMAIDEKPDVIVIVGDFVDGSQEHRLRHAVRSLEPAMDAPCPVLGVMGNHDYWVDEPRNVIRAIGGRIQLLRNEAVDVGGVTIAGVDDAIARKHDPSFLVPGRHSKSIVTLLHEPDFVEVMPEHVSLQLSGHSHGGQVCLPFGIPIHTPYGARTYVSGYYPDAKVPLYVTRGVGTTGPEMRAFCRPEVTILTLRAA